MIITNKFNLPQTFVNVVKRPTYSKGGANLSATELITSPRLVLLRKANADKIESDVSEMVWSIFGTAIHSVLEHGKDDTHVVEQRLHAVLDGWSISGAIDLQTVEEDGSISIDDYKTCGAWSVMNEKVEWEQQLNIYAWLVEHVKKVKVSRVGIVAIIRDWSRRDAKTREGYPDAPIKVIPIQLWDHEFREQFIRARITEHSNALLANELGEVLPDCTPEQMWEKPTTYAVMKDGGKRAKSVHSSMTEAELALPSKGYAIEVRQGGRTRCAEFCPVSNFCSQNQAYLETKKVNP
jgi:hypothetical protein